MKHAEAKDLHYLAEHARLRKSTAPSLGTTRPNTILTDWDHDTLHINGYQGILGSGP